MAAPSSSGEGITHVTSLAVDGLDWTVGSESFKVTRLDPNGQIMEAIGTTKPSNGGAGFAVGCIFVHSDGTTNTARYINEGSVTSCTFNAIAATAATTYVGLTDGPGSITAYAMQVGDAAGTALTNGLLFALTGTMTAGNVLYSDGTKFAVGTQDTAGLVSKAGDQTGIAGNKTFTGTVTAGSIVTAGSTTTGSLISTPVDSDFAEGNVTLAVANKLVVTVDGAGAGSAITGLTGGTAGQVVIIVGICSTADVSLTDGANLQLAGGTGPTLSANDTIMLACVDGTKWVEVCRSNN